MFPISRFWSGVLGINSAREIAFALQAKGISGITRINSGDLRRSQNEKRSRTLRDLEISQINVDRTYFNHTKKCSSPSTQKSPHSAPSRSTNEIVCYLGCLETRAKRPISRPFVRLEVYRDRLRGLLLLFILRVRS